ncbi:MAG TPA: hypothetical protein VJV96_03820 [Candidatus Angelobacter sp.]|nr:hypothetical protein [Candidatus Angelobacter sp.]
MKKSTKNIRRAPKRVSHARLISQLENAEGALQQWIASSPRNSDFFRRDPIGAMRAAGLDIDDDIMLELETVTSSIARKLK